MSGTEQLRASVRFPIRIPIHLMTDNGEVIAETEDISASGLAFNTDQTFERNARVEFTMAMPGAVMGALSDVMVRCVGRVVRCQEFEERNRAAAVIDEYYFLP